MGNQNQAQPKHNTNGQQPAADSNAATAARVNERAAVTQVAAMLRDGLEAQQSNDDGGAGDGGGDGEHGSGGGEGADDAAGDASGDGQKRKPKKRTVDEVAKALGVTAEDLYNELEVRDGANGDGETRTLGALKDLATQVTDLDARELAFEERRVDAENELLRARQDMAFIVSQLPASAVSPEIKKKAQAERERINKVERARTLEAIQEWSDDAIEQRERDGISEHMQRYGFGASDLERINDHRWLKLLRDFWSLKVRVNKAVENSTEDKGKPAGKGAASGQPRVAPKPATANSKPNAQKTQVTKIGQLLRDGA